MSIDAMVSLWLRRNVFQPCDGGRVLRAMYLATVGLADIDAELEQLAVDPRRAPKRIGDGHLPNQLANVRWRLGPTAARSRFPPPVGSKASGGSVFQSIKFVQHYAIDIT